MKDKSGSCYCVAFGAELELRLVQQRLGETKGKQSLSQFYLKIPQFHGLSFFFCNFWRLNHTHRASVGSSWEGWSKKVQIWIPFFAFRLLWTSDYILNFFASQYLHLSSGDTSPLWGLCVPVSINLGSLTFYWKKKRKMHERNDFSKLWHLHLPIHRRFSKISWGEI